MQTLHVLATLIGAGIALRSGVTIRRRMQRYPWQHDGVRSVIAWTVFGICAALWGVLDIRWLAIPAGVAVASIATVRCSVHPVFNEHWLIHPLRNAFFLIVGSALILFGVRG